MCLEGSEEIHRRVHGLRTPGEEMVITAWPKINSQSQIFRYGQSIFCLPHQPKFLYFFDLCLQLGVRSLWSCVCPYHSVLRVLEMITQM